MKAVKLEVQPREAKKRNRNKVIRAAGRVPGVVYGGGENHLVEVDNKIFENIVHSASSDTVLLDLKLEGNNHLALVQEVQHHPLSRHTLHIDFREVKPDQKVIVTLPTVTVGEPVGVKTEDGNLEHVLRYVRVKGTPANLPDAIEIEVSELGIGQTLHLSDLVMPADVEVLGNPSNPVISITRPRVIEEVVTEEDEELAEGEVAEGEAAEGKDAEGKAGKGKAGKGKESEGGD